MEQRDHFPDLDGMRGILAVVVMLHHYGLNALLGRLTGGVLGLSSWNLCVDFFFLLSGFVLTRSYARRPVGIGAYFAKRLFRLAPVYYLTLLAMLAVPPALLSAPTVAANVLMVAPFLDQASINPPSWSVPYELFLPVLILLAAPRLARWRVAVVGAGLAVVVILSAAVVIWTAPAALLRPVFGLGGGMLLYLVHRKYPAKPSQLRTWAAFVAALALMTLTSISAAAYALFFPVSALAIYLGAPTRTLLSSAPLQALGRWSYSVYLIHFPVMCWTIAILGESRVAGSLAIKGAWVAVTILLAAAAYRWIEAPMIAAGAQVAAQLSTNRRR